MASLDSTELDIDELVDKEDENDLNLQFKKAADHLAKKLVPQGVDDSKLLALYGYYKQAMEGPCNVPKPSFFDFKGKAKWEAWKEVGTLSKEKAKVLYIETIKTIDPSYDRPGKETKEKEHWVKVSTMVNENKRDANDVTIVDLIKDGKLEELVALIKTFKKEELQSVVNELDDVGLALIHWAADSGQVSVIKLLLENGADINQQDCDGQTALHYAANCGQIECVKFLLNKCARRDVLDNEGKDAFSVASDDEVKELLRCS